MATRTFTLCSFLCSVIENMFCQFKKILSIASHNHFLNFDRIRSTVLQTRGCIRTSGSNPFLSYACAWTSRSTCGDCYNYKCSDCKL